MIILSFYLLGLLTIFIAAGATDWFWSGAFHNDPNSSAINKMDQDMNQVVIIIGIIGWPLTLPIGIVAYLCYLVCSKAVSLGTSLRKKYEQKSRGGEG